MEKQEMFDKAYRGLASQGFQRCTDEDGISCRYSSPDGKMHCAWGWVDTSLSYDIEASLSSLRRDEIGLVTNLENSEYMFAQRLQQAHDSAWNPIENDNPVSWGNRRPSLSNADEIAENMKKRLTKVANDFGLEVPRI